MDPTGARDQLISFKRKPNETCLAAMNRYELLYSRAAFTPAPGAGQAQGVMQEAQKIEQLLKILGPKTARELNARNNEHLYVKHQYVPYDTMIKWALYGEKVNGEYHPERGFTGGVDTLGLHHLSINSVDYPEAQVVGLKGIVGNNAHRSSAYKANPMEQRRSDRTRDLTRHRSSSRDALLDQRRGTSVERAPAPLAQSQPTIPQPTRSTPTPQPSPRTRPSAEPPTRYQEPAPYPMELDVNSSFREATQNQTPQRVSRKEANEARQQRIHEYNQRVRDVSQHRQARSRSREAAAAAARIPQEAYQLPPPTDKSRNNSSTRRSDSYNRGNGTPRYQDDRRERRDRSASTDKRQDDRRTGPSQYPRRSQSGVRDKPPPGETQWSSLMTHSGQRYPKFRIRGIHVPDNYDFEYPPDYCAKCSGYRENKSGRAIRNVSHTAFNCPFYLFTADTPCRICDGLGLTGYHWPRDCMNDAQRGTSN